ncbi:CatB-related O-acetyltransferase [Salegentibacter mishustinae]|uniref:CatB-related O-acetyltransferase n=1 Tax=Salegentibacter mishustinae TaxID=270918 RepID=UPI001CE17AB7|nr:CatB-related O-acetyltransferase [Salegentibacter mishustinae]UBZ06861.1 CatB-related O-acetyltransferase [Salegentibacter mishustinae]
MNLLRKLKKRIIKSIRWDLEQENDIQISSDSFIHPTSKLINARIKGKIKIDEGCKIFDIKISSKSSVEIGRFTSILGPNTDIFCAINKIKIGSFCSIARNVSIQEYNHKTDRLASYFIIQNIFGDDLEKDITSKGDIEIGNDVWIGAQCVILSGARIGDGAVIAANSVVIGDIPPFAIAAGTPAKILKYRFNEDVINKIEEMKWWKWSKEKILKNKNLFFKEIFDKDHLT